MKYNEEEWAEISKKVRDIAILEDPDYDKHKYSYLGMLIDENGVINALFEEDDYDRCYNSLHFVSEDKLEMDTEELLEVARKERAEQLELARKQTEIRIAAERKFKEKQEYDQFLALKKKFEK